ncbi:Signal transduction histidine kinase [Paracoccus pantotrophus]|nr:Signal transduction histidine kinase [Paracoccus pantotrophus]
MNRVRNLPSGLAARFSLLLIVALVGVNLIAALLLAREGSSFDRTVRIQRDMGRLVALVTALEEVDPATGETILAQSRTGYTRFFVAPAPVSPAGAPYLPEIEQEVRLALPGHAVHAFDGGSDPSASNEPLLLLLSVQLGTGAHEGQWLNSLLYPLPPTRAWPRKIPFFVPLGASLLGTLVVGLIFTRRMTAPLQELAHAAWAAGNGDRSARVAETGARELRDAAVAFNDMQQRIADFDAERMRLVAAIGHDLRTPITGLRIRAEMLENDEIREPFIRALDDMAVIAEDLLQYGRGGQDGEMTVSTDLVALLESLCDDRGAVLEANERVFLRLRPVAICRALGNLIDNAIRYGVTAVVRIRLSGTRVSVMVDDDGPGIAPELLERVFEPFFRGEESRNHETGGAGLGLSIAKQIVSEHGGTVTLSNRSGGGLRAEVILNLNQPPQSPDPNPTVCEAPSPYTYRRS